MRTSKICLADFQEWLALVSMRHVHNRVAVGWLGQCGGDPLAFCRVSQMGLLRLLTNTHVMGVDVLRPGEAWRAYEGIMRDSRLRFVDEPSGLEAIWRSLMKALGPGAWTDAYLMAFAKAHGLHMVTFDKGFERFGDARTVILAS